MKVTILQEPMQRFPVEYLDNGIKESQHHEKYFSSQQIISATRDLAGKLSFWSKI